jgi:hypothetical protein|uniref:Uncharacterized protein n=1 Tax=uncultured marine thaumarchaeote KM3_66_E12 TaxID=1456229 RepID=A0A075HCE6_9ARCH|nr:hypothetical protein [uncultured marine thaumarchaeote KM3_66_E12]
MNELIMILTIVAGINIIILCVIFGVFAKMYQKTKAQISVGIMIFSSLMILHNGMTICNYFDEHLNLMMHIQSQVGAEAIPAAMIIHVAEMAGLLVFLKISLD